MILESIIGILINLFSFIEIFFQTDADSARYLISTIIQSEAAIIAIVFTLSLIAVQQTTSTYSSRVIDIFNNYKKNKPFFILLCAYIICIAFSALLLKVIKNENVVPPFIEHFIWIVYALFILLIIALIPYIKFTLNMFKPITLIELLSKNISRQSIESAIKLENSKNVDQNGQVKPIDDTIQPIVDILQGSMTSYDYETSGYGLRIIETKAIQILRDENCDFTCKEAIAIRIINSIKIVGLIAVKQEMERTVNDTVDALLNIHSSLNIIKIDKAIDSIVSVLQNIGEKTTNGKLENSTVYVLEALSEIGIKSIDADRKEITQKVITSIVIITLDEIIIENSPVAYQTLDSAVCKNAIKYLRSIGEKIPEEWELETSMLIKGYVLIGESLIENTVIKRNTEYILTTVLLGLHSTAKNLNLISDVASEIYSIGIKAFNRYRGATDSSLDMLNQLIKDISKLDPLNTNMEYNQRLKDEIDKQISDIKELKNNDKQS